MAELMSARLRESDAVDHCVLYDLCGGLTLKNMEVPPRRVLDIGCGGGLWVLAAAQQWTVSIAHSRYVGREKMYLITRIARSLDWISPDGNPTLCARKGMISPAA